MLPPFSKDNINNYYYYYSKKNKIMSVSVRLMREENILYGIIKFKSKHSNLDLQESMVNGRYCQRG